MLIKKMLFYSRRFTIYLLRKQRHFRHFFKRYSVLYRFLGSASPGKNAVILDKHCRDSFHIRNSFCYNLTCVLLVCFVDLLIRKLTGARYIAVESICMSSTICCDLSTALSKRCRICGMCVYYTSKRGILLIKIEVCRQIA